MEGNDIAGSWSQRNVVVLTPLLMRPPSDQGVWPVLGRKERRARRRAEVLGPKYMINTRMVSWMTWFARQYSMPWEIWSFDEEHLYDALVPPVAQQLSDYIVDWHRWDDVPAASAYLRNNPDLRHVYDSDIDRHELYWQMHGLLVDQDGMP